MTSRLLLATINYWVDSPYEGDARIDTIKKEMRHWEEYDFKRSSRSKVYTTGFYLIEMGYLINERDYLRLKLLDNLPKHLNGAKVAVYDSRPESIRNSNIFKKVSRMIVTWLKSTIKLWR